MQPYQGDSMGSYGHQSHGQQGQQPIQTHYPQGSDPSMYGGHMQGQHPYMGQQQPQQQYNNSQMPHNQGSYSEHYNQMGSGYGPGPPMNDNYNTAGGMHPSLQQMPHVQQQQPQPQPQQKLPQQQPQQQQQMRPHQGVNQSPQDVANSILQMTASYQPNQTVQVPLSKQRAAPYHVPKSPHYNIPPQGNSPTQPQQQQQMQQSGGQFVYPGSSPHNQNQGQSRGSPCISPAPAYLHSPASHHSNQSVLSMSPRSVQSPTGGTVKSPVPPQSPVAIRSPMTTNVCSPVPLTQQLHVSMPSQQPNCTVTQSPTHPKNPINVLPQSNQISPSSHSSAQFTSITKASLQSPTERHDYITDNSLKEEKYSCVSSNPLSSLEQLCKLPERQVVDPKSVVHDACLPMQNECSKNLISSAEVEATRVVCEASDLKSVTASIKCSENDGKSSEVSAQQIENQSVIEQSSHMKMEYTTGSTESVPSLVSNARVGEEVGSGDKSLKEEENDSTSLKEEENDSTSLSEDEEDHGHDMDSTLDNQESDNIEKVSCEPSSEVDEHILRQRLSPNSALTKAKSISCDVKVYSDDYVVNGDKYSIECTNEKLLQDLRVEHKLHASKLGDIDKDCITEITKKELVNMNMSVDVMPVSIVRSNGSSHTDHSEPDEDDHCVDNESTNSVKENQIVATKSTTSVKKNKAETAQKASKVNMKPAPSAQPERTRSLREVPSRLASASSSTFFGHYSDEDEDESDYDDGILMVRKDTHKAYGRTSRAPSQDTSSQESIIEIVDSPDPPAENLVIKDSQCIGLRNSVDEHDGISNKKKGKKGNSRAKKTRKDILIAREDPDSSDQEVILNIKQPFVEDESQNSKGNKHAKRQNSGPLLLAQNSSKRPSRKRRITSPSKYSGDMYYGGDYALDSDEEVKVKKDSRKEKGNNSMDDFKTLDSSKCESTEHDSEDAVVILGSSEDEVLSLPKKTSTSVPKKSCDTNQLIKMVGMPPGRLKSLLLQNKPDQSKPVQRVVIPPTNISDIQTKKSTITKTPVIVSKCDNKSSDKKPVKKRLGRPSGSKTSSKGKLKKHEPFAMDGIGDGAMDDLRLKQTITHMKNKHKKKTPIPEEKSKGPFVHIEGSVDNPDICSVVNNPFGNEKRTDKNDKHKKTASVAVSTVHMARLPSEKSIFVPNNTVIDDSTSSWVCTLCKKHSSYKFLGDLFGPYYTDGHIPNPRTLQENPGPSGSKKKKATESESSSKKSKGNRKSSDSFPEPSEVWVHEDCLAWADGVLLIGQKVYGLEEATKVASVTVSIDIQ